MTQRTLFTIGHSTRTWKEFVALLKGWKIAELVDVRRYPGSKAFPWFDKRRMHRALTRAGIAYSHLPELGGRRAPRVDTRNVGWRNRGFRGYADYMETAEFQSGLGCLNLQRGKHRVAVMCAEAVWWRCHRRLISDAEVVRGIPVQHLMTANSSTRHLLTSFAVVRKKGRKPTIGYP